MTSRNRHNGAAREKPDAPILLFGMPRSGTTWLGKILDSDPGTLYRHEPDSYGRMNFLPAAPDVDTAAELTPRIRAFYDTLAEARDTKIAVTTPLFRKRYLGPLPAAWNRTAGLGTKLLTRVTGELRAPLWLPRQALREARLVVKSIESVARTGVIARALPEARLVLLLRHPYGFTASMLRGKADRHFTDSDSIGEDLGLLEPLCRSDAGMRLGVDLETLRAASAAERLAWQWVLANDKALADAEELNNVRVVRYEDLCADPLAETQRLFEWCGLEMTAQTRGFIGASTSVHRGRYYSVYKDPRQAAGAWRRELAEETRDAVRRIVATSRSGALFADDL